MPSSASRPQTASAASSVKPPAKTLSSANSRCGRRVEQVVAPVDRAAQGLLAARDVARAGAEEVEPAREAVEDRGGGEDLDAGGGELDRERQAVEARADLLDQPLVGVG